MAGAGAEHSWVMKALSGKPSRASQGITVTWAGWFPDAFFEPEACHRFFFACLSADASRCRTSNIAPTSPAQARHEPKPEPTTSQTSGNVSEGLDKGHPMADDFAAAAMESRPAPSEATERIEGSEPLFQASWPTPRGDPVSYGPKAPLPPTPITPPKAKPPPPVLPQAFPRPPQPTPGPEAAQQRSQQPHADASADPPSACSAAPLPQATSSSSGSAACPGRSPSVDADSTNLTDRQASEPDRHLTQPPAPKAPPPQLAQLERTLAHPPRRDGPDKLTLSPEAPQLRSHQPNASTSGNHPSACPADPHLTQPPAPKAPPPQLAPRPAHPPLQPPRRDGPDRPEAPQLRSHQPHTSTSANHPSVCPAAPLPERTSSSSGSAAFSGRSPSLFGYAHSVDADSTSLTDRQASEPEGRLAQPPTPKAPPPQLAQLQQTLARPAQPPLQPPRRDGPNKTLRPEAPQLRSHQPHASTSVNPPSACPAAPLPETTSSSSGSATFPGRSPSLSRYADSVDADSTSLTDRQASEPDRHLAQPPAPKAPPPQLAQLSSQAERPLLRPAQPLVQPARRHASNPSFEGCTWHHHGGQHQAADESRTNGPASLSGINKNIIHQAAENQAGLHDQARMELSELMLRDIVNPKPLNPS